MVHKRPQSSAPRATGHRRRRTAVEARRELLDGATEYIERTGLAEFSLRACAAALGTSHRMLLHHFGSKEHVVAAVMGELRERQLARAVAEVAEGSATPATSGRAMWDSITGDRATLLRNLQLVGLALLDPERYGDIVVASTRQWIDGTKAMLRGRVADDQLEAISTAIVAGIGGLQIDLALSDEAARVNAGYDALERMTQSGG